MSSVDEGGVESIVQVFSSSDPANRELVDSLFRGVANPIFVIGKNREAEALIARFPIAGIVDDFAALGSSWRGLPLIRLDSLPVDAIVLNASTSISPVSVHKRAESFVGSRLIAYSDLLRGPATALPLPAFVEEARGAFSRHANRWQPIRDRFADDLSREIFDKLFFYRLTADIAHMSGFRVAFRDQYFEPFAAPKPGAVFVDCGGFDGDTTEEFVRRHPDYGRVYLFEPSAENFVKAKRRLQAVRDVDFIQLGVSDRPGRLGFVADAGSASAVVDGAGEFIDVTTIDLAIKEPVSFIKMDLEGWELPALRGAAGHISRDKPIMAVAVYHRAADIWEIPEFVSSIGVDYDLYLRHYSEGWSESVMYFVPK